MAKMRFVLSSCLVAAACGLAANAFAAVTRTWTGSGDGVSWSDIANWDCAPTSFNDTARFTGDTTVTLDHTWTNAAGTVYAPQHIKVEGGTVTMLKTADYDKLQMRNGPSVDVAEGATLVSSNDFSYYNFDWFTKKGKGTWRMLDSNFSGQHVWQVDVTAGKVETVRYTRGAFATTNLIIRSGAELHVVNQDLSDKCNLTIEEGATLRLDTDSRAPTIASLTGAGAIVSGPNMSGLIIAPRADSIRPPFTGTFSTNIALLVAAVPEGGEPFVVQRADQLKDVVIRNGAGLRFKSGIGLFEVDTLEEYSGSALFYLEDEAGGPVTVHASVKNPGYGQYYGSGNLWVKNSTSIYQNTYHATGWVRVGTGAILKMGESTVHDFDFSGATIKGLYCDDGAGLNIWNRGEVRTVSIPVRGFGKGSFSITGKRLIFEDIHFHATNNFSQVTGPVFVGGEFVATKFVGGGGPGISDHNLRIEGAVVRNEKQAVDRRPPMPTGVNCAGDSGWYTTVITAGEFYRAASGSGHKEHHMFGGRTYFPNGATMSTTDRAFADGGPAKIVFDGGTAVLYNAPNGAASFNFPSDSSRINMFVSTNGGSIVAKTANDLGMSAYIITRPVVATNGVDGGLSFYGQGIFRFNYPMQLQGPMKLMDGGFSATAGLYSDGESTPFGSGPITLRNATVQFSADSPGVPAGSTMHLATGSESALTVDGTATIDFPAAGQNVTVREICRAGAGSALFLRLDSTTDSTGTLGEGEGSSSLKCTAVPPVLQPSGVTKMPVIIGYPYVSQKNLASDFATYDADAGFKVFTGYVTNDFSHGANSIVNMTANGSITANTAIGGLTMSVRDRNLSIGQGATLSVGNGTDPAVVMLGVCGYLVGTGTVDFGAGEGIITVHNSTGTGPNVVTPKISGSGGLSFVASPLHDNAYKIRITNAGNDYTGGTFVNAITVMAAAPGALSSGLVTVGGGARSGGSVVLAGGGTWANDFRLAGNGGCSMGVNVFNHVGALVFDATATVSGDVELTEETRIVATNGTRGTISGVVSGDKLQILNHPYVVWGFPEMFDGTVALTGHNTYTGGTEVVDAAVAISESDGFGTGDVTIYNSTLEFANTSAISVPNKIEGSGLVRITGGGAVTLTGDHSGFSAPLDLGGEDLTLAAMPDFVNGLTNSANSRCTLTVPAGGRLDFTGFSVGGLEKVELVVAQGGQVDLGGETVKVLRYAGDPEAVVNGTLVELRPLRGLFLMVR